MLVLTTIKENYASYRAILTDYSLPGERKVNRAIFIGNDIDDCRIVAKKWLNDGNARGKNTPTLYTDEEANLIEGFVRVPYGFNIGFATERMTFGIGTGNDYKIIVSEGLEVVIVDRDENNNITAASIEH